MTELKDTFHTRADALAPPSYDLDALMAAGDRTRRRRRLGVVAGVAAAGVLVAGIGFALSPGGSTGADGTVADTPPALPDAPSYAVGSVIHRGSETLDAGVPVAALVVTTRGAVFTDGDGGVHAVDAGGVTDLGDAYTWENGRDLRVVSDGRTVGWLSRSGDGFAVSTYDVDTGRVATSPLPGIGADPELVALDGADAYVEDRSATFLVRGDAVTTLATDRGEGQDRISDVHDGTIAYVVDPEGDDWGVALGTSIDPDAPPRMVQVDKGAFSPDGRHFVAYEDLGQVFATEGSAAGGSFALPSGWEFYEPYGWLDADTVLAAGLETNSSTSLSILTCEVSTLACEVADRHVVDTETTRFAFPFS